MNEPYGSGKTVLPVGGTASAKALGSERVSAHIGCTVLWGSEWPGWWKWFIGEVRLEGVFKLEALSDLRFRESG